jgi:hypothetical protein
MGEMGSPHMGKRVVGDFFGFFSFLGELNPGIWQKGGPTSGGKGAHSLNFFFLKLAEAQEDNVADADPHALA